MITYIIINSSDLMNVNFEELKQSDSDTCVKSLDGQLTLISYENTPSFLSSITPLEKYGKVYFSEEEILPLLLSDTVYWTNTTLI